MSGKSDGNPVEQVGQAVGQAVEDIGVYIRQQREGAQVSLRQLSKLAGVSNPYLSQVERGLRKPSAEILQQIAKGLRISAEALYVRAGILEERPASAVIDAVLADLELTERQKQVLLDIYLSFRRENESESAGPSRGDAGLDPRISGIHGMNGEISTNGEARSVGSGAQPATQDHRPDPER